MRLHFDTVVALHTARCLTTRFVRGVRVRWVTPRCVGLHRQREGATFSPFGISQGISIATAAAPSNINFAEPAKKYPNRPCRPAVDTWVLVRAGSVPDASTRKFLRQQAHQIPFKVRAGGCRLPFLTDPIAVVEAFGKNERRPRLDGTPPRER